MKRKMGVEINDKIVIRCLVRGKWFVFSWNSVLVCEGG